MGTKIPLHFHDHLSDAIPPGVLNAIVLKENADSRHSGASITITAGLSCPRKFAIQRMLHTHVDPTKVWAAQRGTWLHEQMGMAMSGEPGWLTEEAQPESCTFKGVLFGVEMSCRVDALREDFSAVWDYKFRSEFNARYISPDRTAKLEDAAQLNMARMLMEQQTGKDLAGMEMRVWVDAGGWVPTFAPMMSEGEVGRVKPGGGTFAVEEIFEWLRASTAAWRSLAEGAQCALGEVNEKELEMIVRTIPKVGEDMYKAKSGGGNMCTRYCEVADRCFGLEGGI